MADDMVVLIFPTVMDGTVVRWYRGERSAMYGREVASASRAGVTLVMVSREVAMAAYDAHELLVRGEPVSHLETHRRAGLLSGELVSVSASCCADHNMHCEPPSELCCDACTEGRHPEHPRGVPCVLDTRVQAPGHVTLADKFGGRPR